MVGLDDLKDLLQPKSFYDSVRGTADCAVSWLVPHSVALDLTVLLFVDYFNLKSDNICTKLCLLLVLWNEMKIVLKGSVRLLLVLSLLPEFCVCFIIAFHVLVFY